MIAARRPSRRGLLAGGASVLAAGAFARTALRSRFSRPRASTCSWVRSRSRSSITPPSLTRLMRRRSPPRVFRERPRRHRRDPGGRGSARRRARTTRWTDRCRRLPAGADGPDEALSEAAELENLAVASYAFVIPELDRQRLLPTLIGIHSVEARHAAWLATLLETNPFPEAIDRALTLEQSEACWRTSVVPPGWHARTSGDTAWLTAAIADDLGVPPDAVQVVSIEPRDWPDSSLGCPQPDMLYAQVVTGVSRPGGGFR